MKKNSRFPYSQDTNFSPSGSGVAKKQRGRKFPSRTLLQKIKLLAMDVDGVLTDAGMYYAESGDEWKKFNTRDGMGVKLIQAQGLVTAIITMEQTQIVARRGKKLNIPEVFQGITNKAEVLSLLSRKYDISFQEMAYIGDDVNDLPALRLVGLSAAPADCVEEVRSVVDYVCQKKGGEGAVRELTQIILEARNSES